MPSAAPNLELDLELDLDPILGLIFGISEWELFWTLSQGATLAIVPDALKGGGTIGMASKAGPSTKMSRLERTWVMPPVHLSVSGSHAPPATPLAAKGWQPPDDPDAPTPPFPPSGIVPTIFKTYKEYS